MDDLRELKKATDSFNQRSIDWTIKVNDMRTQPHHKYVSVYVINNDSGRPRGLLDARSVSEAIRFIGVIDELFGYIGKI